MALRKVPFNEQRTIQQIGQAKWRSSGLTDKQAKRLRLRALPATQISALGANFHAAGGLYIPYFDLSGKPTKFFRVRYLEPLPGFAGQMEKPQRFVQELQTLNEVYLPPLFKKPWSELANDPAIPLYITEGELKAAAGCAAGLPTLGLGGVDVWRASKRGISFLPILEKFNWKGRSVCIIYDSDLLHKPDVVRAQRTLAQELLARGALVDVASIPAGVGGAKQGLDDFLVLCGGDALKELINNAVAFPESDALWGLNEDVVFIRQSDMVVERASGLLMEPNRFMNHIYANRHFMESITKGKATVLVKKPLAPRWMQWEHRAQMEKITYAPGKPREHEGMWNVWPGWGVQPKKGNIDPWKWLLDFLFKNETAARQWFERWLAYPLQYPGTKLYTAVLLWSREKRMGKGLAMYTMAQIYGANFQEINNKSIKGDFNAWAKNRQFIYANEIRGSEAKIDADWLKNIITSPTVTINEKHLPQYTIPNHMNHVFDSNHPDALFLEDGDQRYLVQEVLGQPAAREKYEWYDKWMREQGGPAHLFHHLLDLNLGKFNPREHAPETPGKRSMIMLGKNDAALWAQLLKEDAALALKPMGENLATNCDLFTPTQLFRAFDPERRAKCNESALGRALAASGFRQLNHGIPMKVCLGIQRIIPVRNVVKWEQATRTEIVDHFNRFWAADSTERKM